MSENIFETATRQKVRINFKGVIGVEALWDLTPEELNKLYEDLSAEKKLLPSEGLLRTANSASKVIDLKMELVAHIFDKKTEWANEAEERKNARDYESKLQQALINKQVAAIENLSEEEIQKRLAALKK